VIPFPPSISRAIRDWSRAIRMDAFVDEPAGGVADQPLFFAKVRL
jgi:hypothetical protein